MSNPEDWCFFEKVFDKKLDLNLHENYSNSLISVSDQSGLIFIGIEKDLHVHPLLSISTYFSSVPEKTLKFDSAITAVCADEIGESLAVTQGSKLNILKITKAAKGEFDPTVVQFESPIRHVEWTEGKIGVQLQSGTFCLCKSSEKLLQRDQVSFFAFISASQVAISFEKTLTIADLPSFNPCVSKDSGYLTCGLRFQAGLLYQIACEESSQFYLNIFNLNLENLQNIDLIDGFPFAPHPSLEGDAYLLPTVSYIHPIPSRNTVLISASFLTTVDVVVKSSDFEKVNFEENQAGQLKMLWTESKENTCRGFAVIKTVDKNKDLYEFQLKDTVYNIAQPPLVIVIDSAGNLILRRFIDLRREHEKDFLCADQSFKEEAKKEKNSVFKSEQPAKNPFFSENKGLDFGSLKLEPAKKEEKPGTNQVMSFLSNPLVDQKNSAKPAVEKPVTISGNLISKMDLTLKDFINQIKVNSQEIDSLQAQLMKIQNQSSENMKNLESKCSSIINNFLNTVPAVQDLQKRADVLEDKTGLIKNSSFNYISQEDDILEGELFEDYNKLEEAVSLQEFYFKNAVKVIGDFYAYTRAQIDPSPSPYLDLIKKTRTYQPSKDPKADPVKVRSLVDRQIAELNLSVQNLKEKINDSRRLIKKNTGTVYSFSVEDSDSEESCQVDDYIDPREYQKIKFPKLN